MACGEDCNCNELKKERDILWERKGDEKKLRDVLLQLRIEYKKAVDDIFELQRVVICQAKEITKLRGDKSER